MIFAAGLGTRLKPLTDTMPKAMVPVGGKPLLQHVLDKLEASGFDNIVVNVHHFADQIINYLKDTDIQISDETEMLLETGGALKKALPMFDNQEPVLIHNVDILSNVDLKNFYEESRGNDATLLVSERKTSRYLLFDDNMRLVGWTNISTGEVKTPHKELEIEKCKMYAFSGIHCVSPKLSTQMQQWPDRFPIMDFYLKHCKEITIRGIKKDHLQLMDVGKIDTLNEAEQFLEQMNKKI